jgi:hypothetical protein
MIILDTEHKYEPKILKQSCNFITESNFGSVIPCTVSHNEIVSSISLLYFLYRRCTNDTVMTWLPLPTLIPLVRRLALLNEFIKHGGN